MADVGARAAHRFSGREGTAQSAADGHRDLFDGQFTVPRHLIIGLARFGTAAAVRGGTVSEGDLPAQRTMTGLGTTRCAPTIRGSSIFLKQSFYLPVSTDRLASVKVDWLRRAT